VVLVVVVDGVVVGTGGASVGTVPLVADVGAAMLLVGAVGTGTLDGGGDELCAGAGGTSFFWKSNPVGGVLVVGGTGWMGVGALCTGSIGSMTRTFRLLRPTA
jgi:hypothetical protein